MSDSRRMPVDRHPSPLAANGHRQPEGPAGYIGREAPKTRARSAEPETPPPVHPIVTPGSWDYNPFYTAMEEEQQRDRLEQQAAEIGQRLASLADQKQAARQKLESAHQPDRERLKEQLDQIDARLAEAGQELAKLNQKISGLNADLDRLHRDLAISCRRSSGSDQVSRAA